MCDRYLAVLYMYLSSQHIHAYTLWMGNPTPHIPCWGTLCLRRYRNRDRMPELEALLSANIMLRRLKTEIRHEVPDKKRQRVSH